MMRCVDQGTFHVRPCFFPAITMICKSKSYSKEIILIFLVPVQTTGRLVDLPRAVYTVDYERHSHHPIIAAGTSNFIYLVKRT